MAELRNTDNLRSERNAGESAQDFVIDVDDIMADADGDENAEQKPENGEKLLFAKSTDVRRRIEETLEVRLLRDELGMDDFDL